jgi:hypothetical protein
MKPSWSILALQTNSPCSGSRTLPMASSGTAAPSIQISYLRMLRSHTSKEWMCIAFARRGLRMSPLSPHIVRTNRYYCINSWMRIIGWHSVVLALVLVPFTSMEHALVSSHEPTRLKYDLTGSVAAGDQVKEVVAQRNFKFKSSTFYAHQASLAWCIFFY